jgi:hypothetical protein
LTREKKEKKKTRSVIKGDKWKTNEMKKERKKKKINQEVLE